MKGQRENEEERERESERDVLWKPSPQSTVAILQCLVLAVCTGQAVVVQISS